MNISTPKNSNPEDRIIRGVALLVAMLIVVAMNKCHGQLQPLDTLTLYWPNVPVKYPLYTTPGEFRTGKGNTVMLEVKPNTLYRVKEVVIDTAWNLMEIVECNSPKIIYVGAWTEGIATKFYENTYRFLTPGQTGTRTATLTITSSETIRIGLDSERHETHGSYKVNGTIIYANQPPLKTDKENNAHSWISKPLPPGTHKITIECSTQMVIDRFVVYKRVLTEQ